VNASARGKNELIPESDGLRDDGHERIPVLSGTGADVGQQLQMDLGSLQKLAMLCEECWPGERHRECCNQENTNCFHCEVLLLHVRAGWLFQFRVCKDKPRAPVTWGCSAGASGPR